ncbi:hypothetical protein FRC01_001738 [Tulasnella sp. 417]|nr:hypothetical protein FRC01_001738 [Tulasnella sp. 417]
MVSPTPWLRESVDYTDSDTTWGGSKAAFTPPRSIPGRYRLSQGSPPKARREVQKTTRYALSPPPPSTPSFRSSYILEDSPPPSPTLSRRKRLGKPSTSQTPTGSTADEASESLDPLEKIRKKIDSTTVKGFSSKYSLKEHQRIARLFMMRCEWGQFKGGLLLDMGLGKTIQVLARICDAKFVQKEKGATCIVAPAGILQQWEGEIKKFAPTLTVLVHQGPRRPQEPRIFEGYDIVLVSYETLRSEWKNWNSRATKNTAMFQASFLRIVLDEGHMISNPSTQQSKACCELRGQYRWLASGTAINKCEDEMLVYFQFLRVITPDQAGSFYGDPKRIAEFKAPFTIGRKKSDEIDGKPLVELPSRTTEVIEVDVQNEDEAAFIRADAEFCDRCKRGEPPEEEPLDQSSDAETELPSSKETALLKLIRRIHDQENQPKIVIFCSWTEALDYIQGYLGEAGYPCLRYDGTMDRSARQQVLRSFEQNVKTTICLVSVKAGGIGLNLNFCNHAIMFNPSWSAVEEDQAFDRLHRIGQVRPVQCYKLIVPGTVEVRILKKQNMKREVQKLSWTAGGRIDGTQSTEMDAKFGKELKRWSGE